MFKTATIVASAFAVSAEASQPAESSHSSSAYGHQDAAAASKSHSAAVAGYDNDQHANQVYGSDRDSRWGRSYDSVKAQSYTDEQYARGVQADDD